MLYGEYGLRNAPDCSYAYAVASFKYVSLFPNLTKTILLLLERDTKVLPRRFSTGFINTTLIVYLAYWFNFPSIGSFFHTSIQAKTSNFIRWCTLSYIECDSIDFEGIGYPDNVPRPTQLWCCSVWAILCMVQEWRHQSEEATIRKKVSKIVFIKFRSHFINVVNMVVERT